MATRHVIVGGGPAGQNAIETIRALEPDAALTLVSDEPPCARMVLPYFLEGKIEEAAVLSGDDAGWKELGVETRFGTRAAGIDPEAHRLRLADGDVLEYDRLLVATGSRVARPPVEGLEAPGVADRDAGLPAVVDRDGGPPDVADMWTLDDARAFLAAVPRETAIVGAGFIAFTVLDGVATRSASVRFVESESQVLPRMLDAPAAHQVQSWLRDRGIEIHTNAPLERLERVDGRRRLHLSGGRSLDADAVVMATGVQPNLELVDGSGIELGEGPGAGILVDGRMRTSAPDVWAAGDVAQGPVLLSDERRVHAIQPTAVDHGRVAGANMAGVEVVYEGSLVMNILAAQGLEAASFGHWQDDGCETTAVENGADRIYRKYVWDDDRLVGGILVGPTLGVSGQNDVGMLKGLVQTGVRLGPWKAYLQENPLDLRRPFVASGATRRLLDSTLLAGRASTGGGFRFPKLPPRRVRSPHHAVLLSGRGA